MVTPTPIKNEQVQSLGAAGKFGDRARVVKVVSHPDARRSPVIW